MGFLNFVKDSLISFVEYNTPKIIHIKNKKLGLLNRFIQIMIITYIIVYVIIVKKGYQQIDHLESSVINKVKGVVSTENQTNFRKGIDEKIYKKIWDANDLVELTDSESFFVTTNIIITPNQTLGTCADDESDEKNHCQNDDYCKTIESYNGLETGVCHNGVCQIKGWCPSERDILPLDDDIALLSQTKYFTVLIKNTIIFPFYDVRRRNIIDKNKNYLLNCINDSETNKYCPIFVLNDIVTRAGEDYDDIAKNGAIIGIYIHWDCNLDFDVKYCKPVYDFKRIDDPNALLAPGWNFRYAEYFKDGSRTLHKAVGIRFVIFVSGSAGRFNVIPLLLNIGSGLGLLAITTIICDWVAFYVDKEGDYYHEKKYELVKSHYQTEQLVEDTRRTNSNTPLIHED